jgi:hypothetical protein
MMTPVFSTTGMHTVSCTTSTEEVAWTTWWDVNVLSVAIEDDYLSPPEINMARLYPNPFREGTILRFNASKAGDVKLYVYDVKGRLVKEEIMQNKTGLNNWTWNGQDFAGRVAAPGVYIISIGSGSSRQSVKAVLLR